MAQSNSGPVPGSRDDDDVLLDVFALGALIGELAAQSPESGSWAPEGYPNLARRCFDIAEAMTAERRIRRQG